MHQHIYSWPPVLSVVAQMPKSRQPEDEVTVYLAKLAEQVLRYEEMVERMKRVASIQHEAYKNVIRARRASWHIVSSIEQKEEFKGKEAQISMILSALDEHLFRMPLVHPIRPGRALVSALERPRVLK